MQGLETRVTGLVGKGSFPNSTRASVAAWRASLDVALESGHLGPFKRVFLKLGFTPKSNQGATEYGAWAQNCIRGTSLLVQWLRFHGPNAGAQVQSPGQGTRSHMPN